VDGTLFAMVELTEQRRQSMQNEKAALTNLTLDLDMSSDWEEALERLEELNEQQFRRFEFELVSRYRTREADQEAIAIALTRKNINCTPDSLARDRVDEILVMLQHVHDPFIH
jgi:hypothetical protein